MFFILATDAHDTISLKYLAIAAHFFD